MLDDVEWFADCWLETLFQELLLLLLQCNDDKTEKSVSTKDPQT